MPRMDSRSWVGFSPATPQNDEGMRIDPAVSVPRVRGTLRAATAAADPPLDPPASRAGSHGLCIGPHAEMWPVALAASSCMFAFPMTIAPAARKLATSCASFGRAPVTEGIAAGRRLVAGDIHVLLHQHRDSRQWQVRVGWQRPRGRQSLLGPDLARRGGHRLPAVQGCERLGHEVGG